MNEPIKTFRDLRTWKKAHELVLFTYKVTKHFPKEEIFGLVSQMRRAAVSITSNIAEGFGRVSKKEKAQFYAISRASVCELQSQLDVSRDTEMLSPSEYQEGDFLAIDTHRMLTGLIRSTRNPVLRTSSS